MKIRIAKKEDQDAFIGEIIASPITQRKLNAVGVEDNFFKNDRWNATFVGEENGELVGFVRIEYYSSTPSLYIDEIYVLKNFRKNGYARQLIEYALQFAKYSWNYYYIYAFTIENKKAENLFSSLGFKNKGMYRDYYLRNGRFYNQTFWRKNA